jgi:von Willebrand factor type D domain
MSGSDSGAKPAETGLVDMGEISFYGDPSGALPIFTISDLTNYPGSFGEIVLNVTWAELQPTENGPLDTSAINSAIAEVQAYNTANGDDLGIKLRVWGGFTAPEWAQNIDGPAITVTGQHTANPEDNNPVTIGRFWTADYIDAWTGLQNQLAALYDNNPVIRGISQTAGASATDEPFVPLSTDASFGQTGTVNQIAELQAGGYADAAEELMLRAAVADYSAWATTPLDYTMNLFHLQDSGKTVADANFTLAVLQEAENSTRLVQAGNHALDNPLYGPDSFVYAQLAEDAALNPATVPGSYQTASPAKLAANAGSGSEPGWGSYADWPSAVSNGVAAYAGDIELWDLVQNGVATGFTALSPSQVQDLAQLLAAGTPPTTGAPDDGAALGFIAPASVAGAAGTIAFTGVDAVLLASATNASSYTITVTSTHGAALGVTDPFGTVSGSTSGPSLTFTGTLAQVNTVLASLTDTLASGTDIVEVAASDSQGDAALRSVGVATSAPASSTDPPTPPASRAATSADPATFTWTSQGADALFSNSANWTPAGGPPGAADTALFTATASPDPTLVAGDGAVAALIVNDTLALAGGSAITVGQNGAGDLDIANQTGAMGSLVLGGVESTLSVARNLQIGANGTLLAALAPSAYSTVSLTIGGTLDIEDGGSAHFTGALGARAIDIANGGALSGDGALTATGAGPIVNDGTIEAASDQTLGLQQLSVVNAVAGDGTLIIDPGATLTVAATGPHQTVSFAPATIAQLSDNPYSPSSLVLETPFGTQGAISGFSFADSLVLDGIAASGANYDSATNILTVGQIDGGASLSFSLSGTLDGLVPSVSVTGGGADAQSTITFVAPSAGVTPSASVPATLEGAAGAAVLVPDIVLAMPLPATLPADTDITVTLFTLTGSLAVSPLALADPNVLSLTEAEESGALTVTPAPDGRTLTLSGTLAAVETGLQSLTYTAAADEPTDSITVTATDYAGSSAPTTITVYNNSAPLAFDWAALTGGSFSDPADWTAGGATPATPPGGTNIASFGPGTYSISGDGAVGEVAVTGAPTLTGQVTAQGRDGVAVNVDRGGALTLAGGAVLTAEQQAVVGNEGTGILTVMGGALALTGEGAAGNLMIGESAGSTGTVFDLEQITAAGAVTVGDSGSGALRLLGVASSLSDSGADIGALPGGEGAVSVDGGEWANAGQLTVGDQGAGTLLIGGAANGVTGQVTAYDATIGGQAGGDGNVTLAGGDLLIANAEAASSTLAVGVGGAGSLTIEDGDATVGVAQGTLPEGNNVTDTGVLDVGSAGTVQISGDGALEVDGSATIDGAATVGRSENDSALFAMALALAIDGSGSLTLGGADATVRASTMSIAEGGEISGAGTLSGDGGGNNTVMLAGITNDGQIAAAGGDLLVYGGVGGSGQLSVASGATLTLQAAVDSGQTLAFSPKGEAVLDDPRAFAGTITGFGTGDKLDLASTNVTSATWSAGVLTLETSTGPLALEIAGNYAANAFSVQPDGAGGTLVTLATGGGEGDVHMLTFDGLRYDFQAVGEFVAVRSTEAGTPFQIQIETSAANGNVSITTELAAALSGARVTFAIGRADPVWVNGAPDTSLQSGATQGLAGGTLTELSSDIYRLTWNTGESVTVSYESDYLNWSVSLGPHDEPGAVQGLLGSDSGQATDFQLPDGTVLAQPLSSSEILGAFADAWRVTPDTSLFDDAPVSPIASSLPASFISAHAASSAPVATTPTLQDLLAQSSGDLLSVFTPAGIGGAVDPSTTAASLLGAAAGEAALETGSGLAHDLSGNPHTAFAPDLATPSVHF